MDRLGRIASAFLLSSSLAPLAVAQTPPAPRATAPAQAPAAAAQAAPTAREGEQVANPRARSARSTLTTTQQRTPRRRSIVHHYPYPYPNYYVNDRHAGFRNPGGVGRYSEYYPPGDRFQVDGAVDPVRVATFQRGGGPTMADQRAAQQIGVQKDSVMQQHIDNYARPYFGYGYGVGFFGGFH